jgi:leader peptidase (prepilin peptidase)/N-methyltransferase
VTGGLGALGGWAFGPAGLAWAGAGLAFVLAWASFIDIDRMILPDILTLGLLLAGLCLSASEAAPSLTDRLIGAIAGYVSLATLEIIYRHIRRREGLGRGDAKLLAAGGAWLGWSALPFICLAASLAGILFFLLESIIRGEWKIHRPVPFGPFLAAGIWILWQFGSPLR